MALVLAPALLPSTRTLSPSRVAGRHPRPSAIVWDELSKELDATVPLYVVANQAGRPLEDESSGRSLFLCYLDPTAAQSALDTAIGLNPTLGLRLLSTGLGSALSQANAGRARLIPAAAELQAARDAYPEGEDWEAGALPVFGCQQMQRTRADGSLATPLFLSLRDAKAALAGAEASSASTRQEEGERLHLVCTSAQTMCRMMVAGEVTMEIIPTVESLAFCRAQADAQATAEEAAELEAGEVVPIGDYLREDIPEGVRSTYARALPNLLREGAGGGIFPDSGSDSGGIFP